jgi:hypothetical protein
MGDGVRRKSMNRLNRKRKQRILDATDNGRCWWIYQQLIANPGRKYRTKE